jgi:hypothetical protein
MENQVTTEAWVGLTIQVGLTAVTALACHWWSKAYIQASLAAAVISNLLFQTFDYLKEGHFNKFALVGFTFGTFYSFLIALVIGLPFVIFRRRRSSTSPSSPTVPPSGGQV